LHWAASGGHLDITEYLIQQKAKVDTTDDVSVSQSHVPWWLVM
jgi:ankyrin repeat protein